MANFPGVYSNDRYTQQVMDLLMRRGDIGAQQAAQRGELWGRVIQGIGQIGAEALAAHQQKKEQSKRDMALSQFVQSGEWMKDPRIALERSIRILGPAGAKFAEGLIGVAKMNTAQDPAEAVKALPMVARGLLAAPESMRPGLYGSVRSMLVNAKLATPDQLPEQWSKEIEPFVGALAGQKEEGGFSLSPGQARFDPTGKQIAALPAAPTEPKVLTLDQQLAQAYAAGDQGKIQNILALKAREAAVTRAPKEPKPPEEFTFNPEGVVLSSFGPTKKNEVRRQAMERGLPVFENAGAQTKGITLAGIVADAKELDTLLKLDKVKAAIGPVAGRFSQLQAKIGDLDPDVQRALQLMTSLSDTELRKRSGAAINESEMQRILRFATDPNRPVGHNTTAVAGLWKSAARDYKALAGIDLGMPSGAEASPTSPGGWVEMGGGKIREKH